MNKRLYYTMVMISLIILPASISRAGVSAGAEAIQAPPPMSDFIPVWTDGVNNRQAAVAYNSLHDEYLVVWVTEVDEYTWDIWGRRMKSDGSLPADGWFNIDSAAGLKLTHPAIAYNPHADQYLIAYECESATGDVDIWGRVVDWNGALHSRLYLDTAPLKQEAPAVAYNSQGNRFLLAYHNVQAGGEYFIELRSLSMVGNIVDVRTIASPPGEYRTMPAVVYNPLRNNFFVVYGIEYSSAPPMIMGRSISTDLGQMGPEFEYTDSLSIGMSPSIALGKDEYLISWFYPDGVVMARRADLEGFPLGPAGGFALTSTVPNVMDSYPQVERAGLSGYLVTWNYFETDTPDVGDIYGRYVAFGQDQPLDEAFTIDERANYQSGATLACKPTGSCLVVNVHNPSAYPAGDYEISARLILMTQVYLPLALR